MAQYEEYDKGNEIDYSHFGFEISEAEIIDDIYLPKYYNPEIKQKIDALRRTHYILTLGDLIDDGVITISTGHEVGKLAYGTGQIPFIRTSDIANWEIKLDPKHAVSTEIYEDFKERQDVQAGDVLMVRDGTYLVGTCAIVSEADTAIVYQSHIYKLRSEDHEQMNPNLLLAVLSSPIVREQIYAKRFTQDIIDTLGRRVRELQLPIPKDEAKWQEIIDAVTRALEMKGKARFLARTAALTVAPNEDGVDPDFLTLIG